MGSAASTKNPDGKSPLKIGSKGKTTHKKRPSPGITPSFSLTGGGEAVKQVRELLVTKQWDEERVKVVLLYPCKVEILKKKLRGDSSVDVSEEEQVLVCKGIILDDDAIIPEFCFDPPPPEDDPDQVKCTVWLVKKQAPVSDETNAEGAEHADGDGADGAVEGEQRGDVARNSRDDRDDEDDYDGDARRSRDTDSARSDSSEGDNGAAVEKEQDALLKSKLAFDLHDELGRIGCEAFADALIDRGFDEKGAFAEIVEDELAGVGLWIHKKARRRITALAELYRRQIGIDERQPKNALEKMAEIQEANVKYTLDNVFFFDTMAELQREWVDADAAELDLNEDGPKGSSVPKNMCKAVPSFEGEDLQGRLNEALRHDEDDDKTMQEYEDAVFAVLREVFASANYRDPALKAFVKANDPSMSSAKLKFSNDYDRKQVLQRLSRTLVENEAASRPAPHSKDRSTLQHYLDLKQRNQLGGKKKRSGEPRDHSDQCQKMIDRIREREHLDDWGIHSRPFDGRIEWCCEKHRKGVALRAAAFLRNCERNVRESIAVALEQADHFKTGMVPRHVLHEIAAEAVAPFHMVLLEDRVDEILELVDRRGDGIEFDMQRFAEILATDVRHAETAWIGIDVSKEEL